MFKNAFRLSVIVILLFCFASCSKYSRLLKSTDFNKKYDMAVIYYNKKNYNKAFPLFEELLSLYKGTDKAEKIYYYYAYCNY